MAGSAHGRPLLVVRALARVAAMGLVVACGAPVKELIVVQSTDVHGYYAEGAAGDGGGLRRLGALVDRLRASGKPVLLVDSGDMWSGTLLSDRTEGELGVEAYNILGYDVAALGNHEFDYGPVGPPREGGDNPFGALEARLTQARFPVLAANLLDRSTGRPPAWGGFAPAAIVERGPWRIGVVGAITEDTPSITFPHVGEHLEFTNATEAVRREAERLRAEGVDLVFVVAHIGGGCEEDNDPLDLSSCKAHSPVFEMARDLPDGLVDVIFGGHTHRPVAHEVGGVAIIQAGKYGRKAGLLEVRAEAKGPPEITIHPTHALTEEPTGITAERLDALLAPHEEEVDRIRAEELGGRILQPLGRHMDRAAPLGSFVCDVLLDVHTDRQVCLVNSGGLRNDLPEGNLTYGQLYDAMPFGNNPAHVDLDGASLLELIRISTAGGHGVVQTSGLKITYDLGKEPCATTDRDGDGLITSSDRDRVVAVTLPDGSPIDPAARYRLVTNSFLARGGDGWRPVLGRLPEGAVRVLADALPVRDQVAAWIRERRPFVHSPDRPILFADRVQALGQDPNLRCHAEH